MHQRLQGGYNESRLFNRLEKLSGEMKKNDELIGEAMKKM